jgi:hypothetical protein
MCNETPCSVIIIYSGRYLFCSYMHGIWDTDHTNSWFSNKPPTKGIHNFYSIIELPSPGSLNRWRNPFLRWEDHQADDATNVPWWPNGEWWKFEFWTFLKFTFGGVKCIWSDMESNPRAEQGMWHLIWSFILCSFSDAQCMRCSKNWWNSSWGDRLQFHNNWGMYIHLTTISA